LSLLQLLNFDFYADPDPAFHSDGDPDPASQNDADQDPQSWLVTGDCIHIVATGISIQKPGFIQTDLKKTGKMRIVKS
jgi:hypothetical protein